MHRPGMWAQFIAPLQDFIPFHPQGWRTSCQLPVPEAEQVWYN